MRAIHVTLWFSMDCLMQFARLLIVMFGAIRLVVAVLLRLRWTLAFVLVRIALLSVRATLFMTSRTAVLSDGKACGSQQQCHYRRA
jgi:hypothetical protein